MNALSPVIRHGLLMLITGLLGSGNSGCVPITAHRGADLTKADQFTIEKNKTTESQLIEQFGQPTTTTTQGDGSKTLIWSSGTAKSHVNVATALVPFAWLADPQRTRVSQQTLMATVHNGVVTDYTLSKGSQEY